MEWWNSVDAMARLTRRALWIALVAGAIGAVTFGFTWIVSVPAIVLAFAAVLCAAFGWFRLDDLRGRG